MKKIIFPECKHKKFKNTKISNIFNKMVPSIICDNCGGNDKIFKEEESIKIFRILGLINNINE